MSSPAAPEPLHRQLGLRDDELAMIRDTLGRDPNRTELAMYAAMWSEHCSYKSSKIHLRTLPTEGPAVLVGPGQDAGAVDVGDGFAAVFKMESHSHPSAIEPYQGAATGVGGIVRDIVSMGARPVALLDPLMFGPLDEERNRWLLQGVVAGIGGYGNCIGVPTVGGEIRFAPPHSANPTVNVLCVGIARADRLMTAATHTPSPGSLMVLYGATTGRDGIGGVSVLASATIEEGSEGSRPSVQIGDPFAEKLLIEASLELIEDDLLEGLQDLGGAGLTCAVSESAARAGLGARLDLDRVPLREEGMEAFEILTSESQERMLAIVHPSKLAQVLAVCAKWGLATAVVATLESGGDLDVRIEGEQAARVPALSLTEKAPVYERLMRPIRPNGDDPTFASFEGDLDEALRSLLEAPNVASKRWVFEQYDRMVQGQTVAGPGSDAAVVRVPGTMKGLAVSVDGNGRYASLDPYLGGAHAVAEAARNVAVTGARPLGITNCLNFGNPERPEVMWQFSEAVRGMRDACLALDTPVTGGNVSFYNESGGSAIWPTPVVGVLGALADYRLRVPSGFPIPGLAVYVLGESFAELGGSEFAETVLGVVAGAPPALDLRAERRLQDLLQEAATGDLLTSAHDCSDGGIAVTLAESAILGGHGFAVTLDGDMPPHVLLFGESASRVVVSVAPEREGSLRGLAATRGVPFRRLGETGGPRAVIDGMVDATVAELTDVWEGAILASSGRRRRRPFHGIGASVVVRGVIPSAVVELPPFSEFLEEHRGTVYRFLMAAVGPHEADDAFQETFVSALRAYPRLTDASKLDRWVLRIASRKAIDHHRAAGRRAIPSGDLPEHAAPPGGRAELDGDLRAAVASLPPKQRVAVVHRHVLDRSYADVADVMGISEEAARANVYQGVKKLRELMT